MTDTKNLNLIAKLPCGHGHYDEHKIVGQGMWSKPCPGGQIAHFRPPNSMTEADIAHHIGVLYIHTTPLHPFIAWESET